jgi:hypothetical protein
VPARAAHVTLTVQDRVHVRDHPAARKTEAGGARELTNALQAFYERGFHTSR